MEWLLAMSDETVDHWVGRRDGLRTGGPDYI